MDEILGVFNRMRRGLGVKAREELALLRVQYAGVWDAPDRRVDAMSLVEVLCEIGAIVRAVERSRLAACVGPERD